MYTQLVLDLYYQKEIFAEKRNIKKEEIFPWKIFSKKQKSQKTFFSFLFWKIWKSKKNWIEKKNKNKFNSDWVNWSWFMKNEECLTCFTFILAHDDSLDECYQLMIVPSEIKINKNWI